MLDHHAARQSDGTTASWIVEAEETVQIGPIGGDQKGLFRFLHDVVVFGLRRQLVSLNLVASFLHLSGLLFEIARLLSVFGAFSKPLRQAEWDDALTGQIEYRT